MEQRNVVDIKPGTLKKVPGNVSPIVSMCVHKGHIYIATSNGVFRFNEQQQKFEPLQFVSLDE